jgi:hypothetical protein
MILINVATEDALRRMKTAREDEPNEECDVLENYGSQHGEVLLFCTTQEREHFKTFYPGVTLENYGIVKEGAFGRLMEFMTSNHGLKRIDDERRDADRLMRAAHPSYDDLADRADAIRDRIKYEN